MNYIAERRLEEKEARRKQIVDAAEEVYADTGWDELTIDQVARRARLSRALVYVYFKDKFDLHCAICERALLLLRDRFEQAAARHARGRDQVEALGRSYVAFSQEVPHYFQALARFEAHSPTHMEGDSNEAACMVAGERVHEIMVECITRGMQDGSIRADLGNPYLTAVTLWGFMHGIIQIAATKANMLAGDGISTQQLIDHALRMSSLGLSPGGGES
jgi:AcrR family transcriptional regulator